MSKNETYGHSRRHADGIHTLLHALLPSTHRTTTRVREQVYSLAEAQREDLLETR